MDMGIMITNENNKYFLKMIAKMNGTAVAFPEKPEHLLAYFDLTYKVLENLGYIKTQ